MKHLLILITILAIFLRFFLLDKIPPGLNVDEAYQGYNAYSILLTGKDHFGKSWPFYFRTFGTFQSPLYTYLTIVPVFLFNLSIFSTRFISAVSGVLIIILTYFIIGRIKGKESNKLAIISAVLVAISPWAIFFSRNAIEANLALLILLAGLAIFVLSLDRPRLLILASAIFGLSTYAYQAQRLSTVLFISLFIVIFRKSFSNKKIIIISLVIFFIIQIPQLVLIGTEASSRRLDQVSYWNNLSGNILENTYYLIRKFAAQYTAYLSPKNLFFDPDPQKVRSIPDLSVFYSFMIIPFLLGLREIFKVIREPVIRIILLNGLVSLIPAALTTEPFYTMRILPFLWFVTIVIALGTYFLFRKFSFIYKCIFITFILILSLGLFYPKYFILLKYERSINYGYPYIELAKKSEELKGKKLVLDSARDNSYILLAFYKKNNPLEFQKLNALKNISNYYNDINLNHNYLIGNIEMRPISWKDDAYTEQFLAGDYLAISPIDEKEHKLTLIEDIKGLDGAAGIKLYKTNPEAKRKN